MAKRFDIHDDFWLLGDNPVLGLFKHGDDGFLRDPRTSPLYSDGAASTPAIVDGPVRWFFDMFADRHVSAADDAARATLREAGRLKYIEFNGTTSLLRGLNSSLVLSADHTEVVCFDVGNDTTSVFCGLNATATFNDYTHFQSVSSGTVGNPYARSISRFDTDLIATNLVPYDTSVLAGSPYVFTRQHTAPGNLSLQVNGNVAKTIASNWLPTTATAADTTLYCGSNVANKLINARMYYHFYINRVLSASELALVQNAARIAGGIAAW